MSWRRGVSWASCWTRQSLRRPSAPLRLRNVAVLNSVADSPFLLPMGVTHVRRNHDETDNIGVQVTLDIMNKPRSKDDDADDVTADNLYVTSFSTTGFKLSNTYGVVGPCILFPRTILSWNVKSARDITPESLTLFSLLEPRLDVLIIGIGDGRCKPDAQKILTYCRRLGINVEILNTEEACATFNFLNGERRHVAAALIPPEAVSLVNPEYFLSDDDFSGMEGGVPLIERAHPLDPTHPRNWLQNPEGVLTDNAIDSEMSKSRRQLTNKRDAAEMRYTEDKIKADIDAMEDRFDADGQKVLTELEKESRALLEKDLALYGETGVMSDRLQLEMAFVEQQKVSNPDVPPIIETVERFRTESWKGLDTSQRFRKKFDKLYDIGQDDVPATTTTMEEAKKEGKGDDAEEDTEKRRNKEETASETPTKT